MESNNINITPEQLQELLAGAIRSAKAPDPEEQEKKDQLKAQGDASRKAAREQVMAEIRSKESRQNNCRHKKDNDKWSTGGQVIGGNKALLICQRCQKTWMWEPSAEVVAALLSGDLTLHQAEPPNISAH
jgi:hypothetical protein